MITIAIAMALVGGASPPAAVSEAIAERCAVSDVDLAGKRIARECRAALAARYKSRDARPRR